LASNKIFNEAPQSTLKVLTQEPARRTRRKLKGRP
jgi:hypothetical protein